MKRIIVYLLVLTSFLVITPIKSYADGQYAMWVQDDVRLTQGIEGSYSHTGMNSIDIVGVANSNIKAPFDATIVEIQATYDWGNAIIITSKDRVHYADGSYDYMTVVVTHDNDISDCYVGRELRQGEVFAQHGNYGHASGVHTHLTVVRGGYAGYEQVPQTGYFKYVNDMNPADALFLYESTVVYETCGLNFKKITVHPTTYTVSYNANGGENPPSPQTKQQGTALTLSSSVPTRGNVIREGYTVSFDANGGSVSPTSKTEIITTSYSFNSWNTASNGNGTSYAPGARYTRDEDVTLYAMWNSLTIYNPITLPVPTRTGYRALGWSTSPTAATAQYQPGGSYSPDKNVTLYAIWEPLTYTVHFDANGGTGAPGNQTKTYGQTLTLPSAVPTRKLYKFLGWATSANASQAQYLPGASYSADGDATLYAVWKLKTFTVHNSPYLRGSGTDKAVYITGDFRDFNGFCLGDGQATISLRTGDYAMNVSYTRLTLAPSLLDGLSARENSLMGFLDAPGGDRVVIGKINITPAYTITYDADGGVGAPLPQTMAVGEPFTVSSVTPTRADEDTTGTILLDANGGTVSTVSIPVSGKKTYSFKEWIDELPYHLHPAGPISGYKPGQTYDGITEDLTLRAYWKVETPKVKVTLPKPIREGYTFQGWRTLRIVSEGGILQEVYEDIYWPGENMIEPQNVTLTAKWVKDPDFFLPADIATIEEEAFANCAFFYPVIPDGVVKIPYRAFADCRNLCRIYIPKSVKEIDPHAFDGVNGLTIIAENGSYAGQYAEQYGFNFEGFYPLIW